MTGVTTGQTALPTATDADDTEQFLTVSLTTALQAVANLFESATGHDHTGSGKGKPIGSAGIASGIILTSPHMTTAVVDSGGLTVTAGNIGVGGAARSEVGIYHPLGASLTATGGGAYGMLDHPTLVAAANSDALFGLSVSPTYTRGAFTGITAYGIRVVSPTGGGVNNYGVYVEAPSGGSGVNQSIRALGAVQFDGDALLGGTGKLVGFFGNAGTVKPNVTGAKGGNVALGTLVTVLAAFGLITDSTTA